MPASFKTFSNEGRSGFKNILFLYKVNDILNKIRANVSCKRGIAGFKTGIIFQTGHENDTLKENNHKCFSSN